MLQTTTDYENGLEDSDKRQEENVRETHAL